MIDLSMVFNGSTRGLGPCGPGSNPGTQMWLWCNGSIAACDAAGMDSSSIGHLRDRKE